MNSELPKVDITYGTKRNGLRKYVSLTNALLFCKNTNSIKVTTNDGDSFISNVVKVSGSKNLIIMDDRRTRLSDIATVEIINRHEINKTDSVLGATRAFEQLEHLKTFNLILNKAHAVGKRVSVFLKSGDAYNGVSKFHDFDSVQLETISGNIVIMYDAINRIVPLEEDDSLAE
uniref:Repressor of phase-1 flagellin n=1 Tax=Pectobacterium carotovorum TaxID=554 RepID=A0A0K0MPT5_PECCA|nr:hypothetical protein [Pectobacterium carotovorum]AKG47452.1 Repressor of phase-1 flagellin [Pectobacterium carotovorum]